MTASAETGEDLSSVSYGITTDNSGSNGIVPCPRASRAYQLEMFQASLRENVIVTMDTGSGKTQIAILRIQRQLEITTGDKIIWFLAPTVLLCAQQCEAIKSEIPSISMRLITGADAHTWSVSTWKSLLNGAQAAVSTYQVLLDALEHGFIKLKRISLLIFDEAHNCVGGNPGGRIMSNFYHAERKLRPNEAASLPAILGLTATPSMKAHVAGLQKLENLLDAKCISPSIHRQELLAHVKQPELRVLECDAPVESSTESMASLQLACSKMEISEDPYFVSLQAQNTEDSKRKLSRVITNRKTWSRVQISTLLNRSKEIQQQLGPWAADLYIWKSKNAFLHSLQLESNTFDTWVPEEKLYVAQVLQRTAALEPPSRPSGCDSISDKVHLLLRELLLCDDNVTGIIFVKERVATTALAALLSAIPQIRDKFRVGCMVGTSSHPLRRRAIYESLGVRHVKTLDEFRQGSINLLIATAVLEEGIDVPACNFVICFDPPATPKAFIQRRGRARMHDSKLILFSAKGSALIDQWSAFEEEIKQLCQDSERKRQIFASLEELDEGIDLHFRVPISGARLDHGNAKQHLEHFCRSVSSRQYTDNRPFYMITHVGKNLDLVSAEVILPAAHKLRRFQSSRPWKSEKNAKKDAAFQACMALYNTGLLNKHLLPLETDEDFNVETRASIVGVQSLVEPWVEIANAWSTGDFRYIYTINVHGPDDELFGDYTMTLPVDLGPLLPIPLYLDYNTTYHLVFSKPTRISAEEANKMPDHTSTLVGMHFCHRWPMDEAPHVIKFTSLDDSFSLDQIGNRPFNPQSEAETSKNYLIRDHSKAPSRYIGNIPSKPSSSMVQRLFRDFDDAPDELYLNLVRWTRRTDFLHPMKVDPETQIPTQKTYACVLPVSYATIDSVHIKHARFGMLIPSLIHTVETLLIARQLSTTLLKPLEISNLLILKEAISARSATEPSHYERLEFLGDSILKYCTSMQAAATNLNWSEGYLSRFKDRIVANSRLSRAAIDTGLSRFILTIPFTGQKWRPFYITSVLEGKIKPSPKRQLSTKVLADVVESLIGVAYTVGGIPKAIQCLSVFIGECDWIDPSECREEFFAAAPDNCPPSADLDVLEELLGYSFKKKSLLLEARTHSSYIGDIAAPSWERLEFLGDAVLDNIIVRKLINHQPPLPHSRMHMVKTAMVNKDFLAFISLEEREVDRTESFVGADEAIVTKKKRSALWRFIRHSSNGMAPAQLETARRHADTRDEIMDAIHHSDHYPWHLLTRLHASKFYSDFMEALVGAIWVDSGSLEVCEAFLWRCGMMPYLERILGGTIHMQHPKEELGKIAQTNSMVYNISEVASTEYGKAYNCKLVVAGRALGEGIGGLSPEEARVKAATAAVALLKLEAASPEDEAMANG